MLLEPEELKASCEMDPTILEFAQKNPAPPVPWDDAAAVYAMTEALTVQSSALLGPPESGIIEEYQEIPMSDGYQSTHKIHRPAQTPADGSPLIALFYGGGWISGNMEQMTVYARAFVRLFGAVTVTCSYRLAPQHKFPTSQMDAYDSVKWLSEHASAIHADPSKGFIVGGMSAGGNCTAAVTTKAAAENWAHPITGQWLCVPALMEKSIVPEKYRKYYLSREQNKNAPIIDTAGMDSLERHTSWDPKSPLRHPILSSTPLSKIPPTYTQACGMDPIRDDALIYDEMLKEAGVKTKCDFYPGGPHTWFAFMPGLEITNRAIADIMIGIGWLLGKEVTAEESLKAVGGPLS